MTTFRAAQVASPRGQLALVDRTLAEPGPGTVRVAVEIRISGTVHGHPAGASNDLEDTLNFAALQGIKPMVEVLPLEKAADGYQRMLANQARFRVVLTTKETSE